MSARRDRVPIIRPRGEFDRRLAHLERKRIFEHTPAAVDLDVDILTRAIELADEIDVLLGETDEDGKRVVERGASRWLSLRKVQLEALQFGHRIVTETFLDRTIAAIQRVDLMAVMAKLPGIDPDAPPAGTVDQVAQLRIQIGQDLRTLCKARMIGIVEPVVPRDEEVANG